MAKNSTTKSRKGRTTGVKQTTAAKHDPSEQNGSIKDVAMKRSTGQLSEMMQRKQQANGINKLIGKQTLEEKISEKNERSKLVLWRHPFQTIYFFVMECGVLMQEYFYKMYCNKRIVLLIMFLVATFYAFYKSPGPHQLFFQRIEHQFWWCLWWLWLGILSSVGLGTGLHTFLLYLGPHLAAVTLAAAACNSLDFPSPPYPDEIVCPDGDVSKSQIVTIWSIMSKVRLETFMWGAGTALGELPPYFMARGARLSGHDPDDEEMAEFEELQRKKEKPQEMSWLDTAKLSIEKMVEKVGFFGILACASIPNPLFDLAGITCGHFLVPFWTFFGATLIGKAIVKMHLQKVFVIVAFNESLLDRAVALLAQVPVVGGKLEDPFKVFLKKQKENFHRKAGEEHMQEDGGNILGAIFEKIVLAMIIYFVLSIVNSFAQSYHKRVGKKLRERKVAQD